MAESILTQDGVEQDRSFVIYKHTSPSGKAYIGQTCDYARRNSAHRAARGECESFHAAVRKYGWDGFLHEVLLDGLTAEEANKAESRMIAQHKTLSPYGYNLQTGGGNFRLAEEARRKISAAMKGREVSTETRQRMRETNLVVCSTPEYREKVSSAKRAKNRRMPDHVRAALLAANVGRERTAEERSAVAARMTGNTFRFGSKATEETRRKMSESKKGKKKTDAHKSLISEQMRGNQHALGAKRSDETKAKMRAAALARWEAKRKAAA